MPSVQKDLYQGVEDVYCDTAKEMRKTAVPGWQDACKPLGKHVCHVHINSMTKVENRIQAGHTQGGRPNPAGDPIAKEKAQEHVGCQV